MFKKNQIALNQKQKNGSGYLLVIIFINHHAAMTFGRSDKSKVTREGI